MLERIVIETEIPRLDRHLADCYPQVPRSRWDNWIREGRVTVNGVVVTKGGTKLKAGSVVETGLPDVTPPGFHLDPEDLPVTTLYEDDRLWIVDKPAGMVVHPGPGHGTGTLVNALLHRLKAGPLDMGGESGEGEEDDLAPAAVWPGLVHRLDRFTTGCIVMAKDAQAQASLQAQFKARTVEKRYLALARNSRKLPELGSLLIDEPIARHRLERLRMTISAHGRPSQTRVRVLGRSAGLALVACDLLTGRTHQIRIHLSHLGAPLLGDPMYGGPQKWQDEDKRPLLCEHPALHAFHLALDHPTDGRRIVVEAPLPAPFQALLDRLGLEVPPGL